MNPPNTLIHALEVVAALTAVVVLIVAVVQLWRLVVVRSRSAALSALKTLNRDHASRLIYPKPFAFKWQDRVQSKAKFDRYDYSAALLAQLAAHEEQFDAEIASRMDAHSVHRIYRREYGALGTAHLGRTSGRLVRQKTFNRVESKIFGQNALPDPGLSRVTITVRYTSPKGRNNYVNPHSWTFQELIDGMREMRRIRDQRSTSAFLRQQERNRMTDDLRYRVFKADGFACRVCGASRATGATLHVDHIQPVSKGGKTEWSNLQTLCSACNFGKSNRH